MPLKTSCLQFLLCLIVTVVLAGNYHHHHHRNYFRTHHPNHHETNEREDQNYFNFQNNRNHIGPYHLDFLEGYVPSRRYPLEFVFVGNQKPHGHNKGHNKGQNQKPCHELPPGLKGRPEGSLPPGHRKKGPPCPGPSFEVSSTQPPSFENVDKAYGNKDFQFKDVQEFVEDKPYEIQGYTKDDFPVILLKKIDIRK